MESIDVVERTKLLSREIERIEREEGLASRKYRKRRFCELAADEVVAIAHAFVVEEVHRRDIAEEHRVSVDLVSRVVRHCKANDRFISDLRAKESSRFQQIDAVKRSVAKLMTEFGRITSIQ